MTHPTLLGQPTGRSRWLIAGTLSLLTALTQAQTPSAPEVAVVRAQPLSVAAGYALDAVVQPVRQTVVSAQTGGRVARLAIQAGQRVQAGQLLALIDPAEAQTGVQRSQAALAQAQAEWHNAQAQHQRTQDLQRKGFVSAAALDTASAQLKAAQAGAEQAQAGVRLSALAQGHTRVLAPFAGWVQATHTEQGALALPGTPLVTVYAPQPLRAVVQVPVSRLAHTQPQATRVLISAADGTAQWVKPTQVSQVPAADMVTQTQEWRLELPASASAALVPGQPVQVRFDDAEVRAPRLVVPAQAVLRRGELTAVYVVTPGGFSLRAVRLGEDLGASGVEVLAGLMPGDAVALDPLRAGLSGAKPKAQ